MWHAFLFNNLPSESQHFKGHLFKKFIADLQLAGLAKRTVYGYAREGTVWRGLFGDNHKVEIGKKTLEN